MPVAVIGGWLWSYSVSKSVVNLGRLAKHFQNRVLTADGTDGTCESQIVALPGAKSVPRIDQKVQCDQGPGSHKALSIAMGEWHRGPTATSERVLRWVTDRR